MAAHGGRWFEELHENGKPRYTVQLLVMGEAPPTQVSRNSCRASQGGLPTRLMSTWTNLTHRPS